MTVENSSQSIELSTTVQGLYSAYINSSDDLNTAGLNLITDLAQELKLGCTQSMMIASMKESAKGHNRPSVTSSHVPSLSTASIIIENYRDADIDDTKASSVLSVAVRVMAQVGAEGVAGHLAKYSTFKELDKGIFIIDDEGKSVLSVEGTLSKAESQAIAKGEALTSELVASVSAITLESIIDNVSAYLGENDLVTLTTSELSKLHAVIGKLIQVEKNTKALAKK